MDSLSKKTEFYAQKELRDENSKFLTDPSQHKDLPVLEEDPELEAKVEIPPKKQVQAHDLTHQETQYVWAGPEVPENLKEWILATQSPVTKMVSWQ